MSNDQYYCNWCHTIHDCSRLRGKDSKAYCSMACLRAAKDHERLADLEAWRAKIEGNICNGCLENVP
jgi:hypothetical protein